MVTLLILYALLALGVSFLCSLLEASLLSLPRSQIELLIEEGYKAGSAMKKLKENIDRPLAAILTFNTIAHTVGATGVGAQAAMIFGNTAVGVAGAVMTAAILIFSEIIPKTIGAVHARSLVGVTVWMTRFMIIACYPIIIVLEWINRLISYQRHRDRISRMEVLATIQLGHKGGSLDEKEHRIILNLMTLNSIRLNEIITPRTVLFALPSQMKVAEVIKEHPVIPFARIPVYEASIDDISGYVLRCDIYRAAAEGRTNELLGELKRPIMIIPQLISVADALEKILAKAEHISLVVDEYGGVEGIVTLEDMLETLLGLEIVDETDIVSDMQDLARKKALRKLKGKTN